MFMLANGVQFPSALHSNVSCFTAVQVQNLYRLQEEIHISFIFLRTHSRLHVSHKVWVGDGGARLFPIPAANVQYACNNRNFANRIETGLCPLLSRQHKPQSHTK